MCVTIHSIPRDDYLNVIRDAGNPQEVRVVMAEALGWFTNSVQRPHILEEIKKMQQQPIFRKI